MSAAEAQALYAARRGQMFPSLSAAQLARVARLAERRATTEGEVLFAPGDRVGHLFVLLAGEIEIVRPGLPGDDLITVHAAGEFTGEMNMLSGRGSLVAGRVRVGGEVLALARDRLRDLVQTDAELGAVIMRAFILRRMGLIASGTGDAMLVGSRHSAGTLRIKEFLTRNGHPFRYLDVEIDDGAAALLDHFHVGVDDTPIVVCRDQVLRNPSNAAVADCLGLTTDLADKPYDVVVVGSGPAGLAAAVYAASEGLAVLVLEADAPGGQAGTSSRIENYLGFPNGVSGNELTARASNQALKFGAQLEVARTAARLDCPESRSHGIALADGQIVRGRTVVIATGARYKKLPLAELPRYEGQGVYYGATQIEAQMCAGADVIVVGGGNSAGQAAVFLSGRARRVHVFVRGDGLAATMSRYLIRRIEDTENITLHTRTEIEALEGGGRLEQVRWRGPDGARRVEPIQHVFLMTGAAPNTSWLSGCVAVDAKGFVKTGLDLDHDDLAAWPLRRPPFHLETNVPGVFAVGDVRAGSMKRVAAAVGEGSTAVALIHQALAEA
jgi:thioredoxin reductase (NADPH)